MESTPPDKGDDQHRAEDEQDRKHKKDKNLDTQEHGPYIIYLIHKTPGI